MFQICDISGIHDLGVVPGDQWSNPRVLSIPKLAWTHTRKVCNWDFIVFTFQYCNFQGEKENTKPAGDRFDDDPAKMYQYSYNRNEPTYDPNRTVRSYNLSDGDLLLFRDMNVPLKVLTDAEEKKIREDEDKARYDFRISE